MKDCVLKFCGEWKTNRMYGKRKLNDWRKVEEDGEVYIEFKVGNNIALCDYKSKNLLEMYSWRIKEMKGKIYIVSAVRKKGKTTTLSFPKLVMTACEGQVYHKNQNKLDNRRKNLYILQGVTKPELDYIVPKADLKFIRQSISGEPLCDWITGKLGGSFTNEGEKCWRVVFQSPFEEKRFYFSKNGGKFRSEVKAFEFWKEGATKRGLVWNNYRLCMGETGDIYVEMQAHRTNKEQISFFFDMDDLHMANKYKWFVLSEPKNGKVLYISKSGGGTFHGMLNLYEITDHIDGNPFNNRRCNLRDGKLLNPRNHPLRDDNKSGVTGVSYNKSKNSWVVQWPEGGKRRIKTFGVRGDITDQQARQKAIEFRTQKDIELNLHEQQRK